MAQLDKIFKAAISLNASDVHVVPGEPIVIRRLARMIKSKTEKLVPGQRPPDYIGNTYRDAEKKAHA